MQLLKSLNQQNVLLHVTEIQKVPRLKTCLSVQGSDITANMYSLYPLKYVHTYTAIKLLTFIPFWRSQEAKWRLYFFNAYHYTQQELNHTETGYSYKHATSVPGTQYFIRTIHILYGFFAQSTWRKCTVLGSAYTSICPYVSSLN